eukprot:6210241-Pleurochrysis_carterae.AAC.2
MNIPLFWDTRRARVCVEPHRPTQRSEAKRQSTPERVRVRSAVANLGLQGPSTRSGALYSLDVYL